jgi:hypothetical protein
VKRVYEVVSFIGLWSTCCPVMPMNVMDMHAFFLFSAVSSFLQGKERALNNILRHYKLKDALSMRVGMVIIVNEEDGKLHDFTFHI